MDMRLVVGTVVTVSAIPIVASAAGQTLDGSWVYSARDASITVRLKPDGECDVFASLRGHVTAAGASAFITKCSYSVRGPYVTLEWKHQLDGERPRPLELVLGADGLVMRAEGETERLLRRIQPGTVVWPPW
jgi:hypothetical protein